MHEGLDAGEQRHVGFFAWLSHLRLSFRLAEKARQPQIVRAGHGRLGSHTLKSRQRSQPRLTPGTEGGCEGTGWRQTRACVTFGCTVSATDLGGGSHVPPRGHNRVYLGMRSEVLA
jgi:hypothetical protein